jgi:hypothetical protein
MTFIDGGMPSKSGGSGYKTKKLEIYTKYENYWINFQLPSLTVGNGQGRYGHG